MEERRVEMKKVVRKKSQAQASRFTRYNFAEGERVRGIREEILSIDVDHARGEINSYLKRRLA